MKIQEDVIYTPKETQEYLKVSQSAMTRMLKSKLVQVLRLQNSGFFSLLILSRVMVASLKGIY